MKDKEKLELKKIKALFDIREQNVKYKQRYFDEKVVNSILKKKTKLIEDAKTCEEIDRIMKGPIPFDDSGITIPEEEMLMWSEASLRAPLNSEATNRYLSLAKSFFGEKVFKECGIA